MASAAAVQWQVSRFQGCSQLVAKPNLKICDDMIIAAPLGLATSRAFSALSLVAIIAMIIISCFSAALLRLLGSENVITRSGLLGCGSNMAQPGLAHG